MIQEKINSCRTRLSELGGKVDPETWDIIRAITAELDDAAASARRLEGAVLCITIPVNNLIRQ